MCWINNFTESVGKTKKAADLKASRFNRFWFLFQILNINKKMT